EEALRLPRDASYFLPPRASRKALRLSASADGPAPPVSTTTSLSPRWSVPNWPGLPASPVSDLRLIGRVMGILLIAGVHLVKWAASERQRTSRLRAERVAASAEDAPSPCSTTHCMSTGEAPG